MTTESPSQTPDTMLAAFADGELSGEPYLQVLKYLAHKPALADRIAEQQRLRQAVGRAMDGPQYRAPAALRAKLAQLARESSVDGRVSGRDDDRLEIRSPVLAVIGRWLPAAVAAVFFVGALVALNLAGRSNTGAAGGLITSANILNASLVDQFGDRHFKCSRDLARIHGTDKFPQDLTKLPGALSDYLDEPVDPEVVDLTPLGFEFEVAGICILPGKGAVHLIYQTPDPDGGQDSLSLWMRPYEESSGIEPDHLYATTPSQETFPMIVWRHGDMVYYLVGDTYDVVERAFRAIRGHRG